jgi:hypothetical protein
MVERLLFTVLRLVITIERISYAGGSQGSRDRPSYVTAYICNHGNAEVGLLHIFTGEENGRFRIPEV